MKKIIYTLSFTTLIFASSKAQEVDDNPVAYMNAMSKTHLDMDKKYMQYSSAVAHGKRARKVEKLRLQVIESINVAKDKILDLPFYKGDKSYRQSNLDYVDFIYKIYNEDYAKIVNVEEISEQSIDELQAYILLKEKVNEKLKQASENLNKGYKDFAAKNNVKLVAGEKSELYEKIAQTSKVNKYYNPIYIIFFKCNWQNNKLTEALNAKKLNDAEQARTSLLKFVAEGLIELEKLPALDGDNSLKLGCKQSLVSFKSMAEKEILVQTDFILKNENFEKLKKSFESKDESSKTKEDIDAFNKAVNEINVAADKVNKAAKDSNEKTNELLKNWEQTVSTFFDANTPKY